MVAHVFIDDEFADDTTSAGPLVGFVVSKAVGNSVLRNRVKRRLREVVRPLLGSESPLTLPVQAHMVLRALPASSTATTAELRTDVHRAVHGAIAKATRRPSSDAHAPATRAVTDRASTARGGVATA